MAINPCFCWNIKDGTVTVGLWSLVYSLASLVLFGWQLNVISSCQTVTMSQANLQCEYWCPCVGASNERTSALIQGTVPQNCFLYYRYNFFFFFQSFQIVNFPSIICTLAYCIMWWSGDVRDYWLVLTILEMITIFINVCSFFVFFFLKKKKITSTQSKIFIVIDETHQKKKKGRKSFNFFFSVTELEHPIKSGYRKNDSLRRDQHNRRQDYTLVQQSVPTTPMQTRKTTFPDDLVSTWVKEQQSLIQTDSVLAHWPLDPQKGLALPQQIIIPPSNGNIGADGRPQPQTYQINSEIRISYDQNGRPPISHEISAFMQETF
uniref:Bm6216, isoform a n=1 Tax=Brugia malayi TaxID=6279 RepID=A0A1I9G7C3_BRUMA|nr:Bm6216, isoform a [Brugia malayi]